MKIVRTLDIGLLVCAVALTRFLCRSRYLYDVDSVNFALGLDRFDPRVHQPHPPGYFLYVQLGRLFRLGFTDDNTALVALSLVASCTAVSLIYVLTADWFGRAPAVFAGLIFLFSPLAWFHGTVALTYIVEAFFSVLVGYLCWRSLSGQHGALVLASVALGLAAGFRQSSLLFLAPLWMYSLVRASRRQALLGVTALMVSLLAWVLPMLRESGGLAAYLAPLVGLWRMVPARDLTAGSPIWNSVARFCTVVWLLGLCFGSASLLWFKRRGRVGEPVRRELKTFTFWWMTPGVLFFTFVFLKSVNAGYLLIVTPPLFAWLGLWAARWYEWGTATRLLKTATVGALAAVNLAIWLYAPIYCSYGEVHKFESELERIATDLRGLATPEDTLIVGFDSHFLGYRHAAYYLPEFMTVQYPEVAYPDGKRVFAVEDRSTDLLKIVALSRFKTFLLFPLPAGPEYQEYMQEIRGLLPAGAFRSQMVNGREYLSASTSYLHFLLPTTAAPAIAGVYTGSH